MSKDLMQERFIALTVSLVLCSACAGPVPGPDKQGGGGLEGAATGAVAGAVTGFHVGAGSGPGALVGAGVGFTAGAIQGYAKDQVEENLLALAAATQEERKRSIAHEILIDHYKRRAALHPSRDIYPADLFFRGDESKLRPTTDALMQEIALLNKDRFAWSRLVVAAYVRSNDKNAGFAKHLASERCRALGDALVRAGIEPRRLETRAVVIPAPVLLDPNDDPMRYNQAVEIMALDR